jgi:hypothetical protein
MQEERGARCKVRINNKVCFCLPDKGGYRALQVKGTKHYGTYFGQCQGERRIAAAHPNVEVRRRTDATILF